MPILQDLWCCRMEGRRLQRIISGGQTGVDQGALRAARRSGKEIGGWCPPGRFCEAGRIPPEFPLRETPRDRSRDAPEVPRSQRTEWNVRDSDATLVLLPGGRQGPNPASNSNSNSDPGTLWTIACAARLRRALLVMDPDGKGAEGRIVSWLRGVAPRTLHVAGPSEGSCPGIGARTYRLMWRVLQGLGD
uniref:Molybdenum carrier n=1 Tax=Candidatus Kentrum sp. LFY TaxID=2126342 RepID=A0A450UHQ4_9GAMM|nr:MAG: Putative molybdenum carrier [Candidatus Kentron sp. LFY]